MVELTAHKHYIMFKKHILENKSIVIKDILVLPAVTPNYSLDIATTQIFLNRTSHCYCQRVQGRGMYLAIITTAATRGLPEYVSFTHKLHFLNK